MWSESDYLTTTLESAGSRMLQHSQGISTLAYASAALLEKVFQIALVNVQILMNVYGKPYLHQNYF